MNMPTQEIRMTQIHRVVTGSGADGAADDETRDLGFGAVVGGESRQRLLNPDGSFNVRRRGLGILEAFAPYHALLTMSWPRFLGLVTTWYLLINVVFAGLYLLCGDAALQGSTPEQMGGSFLRALWFSVETFATIGYGNIAPVGVPANVIVTVESLVGIMSQALATGLLFARFARPNADIAFSRRALVAPYRGGKAFEFRIANRRSNQLIDVQVRVLFSRIVLREGRRARIFTPLELERDKVAFFPLSWTIVHPIGDDSPLAGLDDVSLRAMDAEFLVLLTGTDDSFSAEVHARSSYKPDEIVWNARFSNIFNRPKGGGEELAIDVSRIHEHEPA